MVRTRINKILIIGLEFSLLCYAMETGVTEKVILCDQGKDQIKHLQCSAGTTVFPNFFTVGSTCNSGNNYETCLSNVKRNFQIDCFDKNNCTLSSKILSENECQEKPKYLNVFFQCKSWVWHHFDHQPTNVYTCANRLPEIQCPLLKLYYVHIIRVQLINDDECETKETGPDCASNRLRQLCDKKWRCESDTSRDPCLFNYRYASLSYWCKDPAVTFGTIKTPTDNPSYSSSDNEIEIQTSTIKYNDLPAIYMDNDGRVIFFDQSSQTENYICSTGWDEVAARVFCQSINHTWIGNATVGDKKISDYLIVPISFNCYGNETNLFSCNLISGEKTCMTSKVAVAKCCQDTGGLNECVITSSSHETSADVTDYSTIGLSVGVPVAIVAVICILVIVVFIRRRYVRESSDRKFQNFMEKDKNETDSPYALSVEGVYDKTNERRHVVNDTDVYSRTVDTVYDSAEQQTRPNRKEETYDHVFGQKTDNDNDQTTKI
ncbi:uncharacterized protein LOC134726233 [Mytilus trossulus]|uniref:uncharacterized protein LOC134726233 n=1 Tax=Mytilus trossulus TaxID=6551 RepID=UPI0030049671